MALTGIFLLILWNGAGMARGDIFTKPSVLSQHETEIECQAALAKVNRPDALLSCIPAYRVKK